MKLMKIAVLAVVLWPLTSPAAEAGKALIVTSFEKPAECISAVKVKQIDGKEVLVPELGFDIDPGVHSLNASAVINTSFCKVVGVATGINPTQPIEYNFEADKTYYLGFDHSASLRKDWKLVIWKVEDSKKKK